MVIGAIFAGGAGSRMGSAHTPKQYLTLGTKPIIIHTAEKFFANPAVDQVLVLCPCAWVQQTQAMLEERFGKTGRIAVKEGGATRNDTLCRALTYMQENGMMADDTVIVTHDAVRPFLTQRIIDENIAAAKLYGACGTYIPACDTIAESGDGESIDFVPERRRMFQTQTPQSFNAKKLKEMLSTLSEEEKAALTDACTIYTLRGEPVRIVTGEVYNIKITYPYDIKIAQALLAAGAGDSE